MRSRQREGAEGRRERGERDRRTGRARERQTELLAHHCAQCHDVRRLRPSLPPYTPTTQLLESHSEAGSHAEIEEEVEAGVDGWCDVEQHYGAHEDVLVTSTKSEVIHKEGHHTHADVGQGADDEETGHQDQRLGHCQLWDRQWLRLAGYADKTIGRGLA